MYTSKQKVADMLHICVDEVTDEMMAYGDAMVNTVANRQFYKFTVTELQDGSDCDEIVLNNYPILEITKVEWEDANRVWHELTAPEYVVYKDCGTLRLKLLPNSDWWSIVDYHIMGSGEAVWEQGIANWRFTYSYGFEEVPAIIEVLAALFAAQAYCLQVGHNDEISSESIGDYSVSYAKDAQVNVKIGAVIKEIVSKVANSKYYIKASNNTGMWGI